MATSKNKVDAGIQGVRPREANIELLRVVLMFLIVVYHCFCHGVVGGRDKWWSAFFSVPFRGLP